jgi:uncharacterized protein involved in exopolysaccharide biosynthesis
VSVSGNQGQPQPADDLADEQPFRVLAIVNTLLRGRWIITGVAGAVTAAAIVMTLLAQPVFTSTAKFLPSQSPAMSSRMGAIIEGGASLGRGDDPSTDYYVALVKSPSFLQGVVTRTFDVGDGERQTLVEYYKVPEGSESERVRKAVEWLGKTTSITAANPVYPNLPRMITLECRAGTAALAAEICSAILDEITKHNTDVRGAKVRQNREFVQAQLDTAKKELDEATEAFATFTARNRKIVSPALEADKDRLERLVRVKEDVYNTLSRQLVLARIEEQETRPSIELIQRPEPPLMRSAPRRTQTVIIAGMLGVFMGCVFAIVRDLVGRMNPADPDTCEFRKNISSIRDDALRFTPFRRHTSA